MKVINPYSLLTQFDDWFAFEQRRASFKDEIDFAVDLFGKFYYMRPPRQIVFCPYWK